MKLEFTLSPSNIACTVLVLLLLATIRSAVISRYFDQLSDFPGPFWGSITRFWITYHLLKGDLHRVLREGHDKWGPVYRCTPSMLVCNDPKQLPVIYHRRADKSNHYSPGGFGKPPGIFNIQTHSEHAVARKLVAQPYTMSAIKPMESLFDNRVAKWIEALDRNFAQPGKAFDFPLWSGFFAYDLVSELAFGKPLGFVESGCDQHNLIDSLHTATKRFHVMAYLHPIAQFLKRSGLGAMLLPTPGDGSAIGHIMKVRDVLIRERLDEIKQATQPKHKDMLQSFLDLRGINGDSSQAMKMEELKAEVLLILVGGSDTTATTMQALLVNLLTHPDIYSRVLAEIDTVALPAQQDDVLESCPLYLACLKETLRLCPPVPGVMPRLCSTGGVELYGHFVPEGVELAGAPYTTQRHKPTYGDDADDFRPDRWLEDASRAAEWDRLELVFGFGSRKCPGKMVAMMELYKAPLHFLRTFEASFAAAEHTHNSFFLDGGLAHFDGLMVRIRRRDGVKI